MAKIYVITGAGGAGKSLLANLIAAGFDGPCVQISDCEIRGLPKERIESDAAAMGDGIIIYEMVKYMPVFDTIPHTRVEVSTRR